MVPPDEALFQVRFNALMDRKRLLLASPGLREGFFVLTADSLPPRRWLHAVRSGGIARFGKRVSAHPGSLGRVDLLITGAVAVDPRGGRLGKGMGFFDLEYAILREMGSVSQKTPVVALVHEAQLLPSVPMEEGDVPVDWIVTPERILPCKPVVAKPEGIPWGRIPRRDLRRIRPLWELWMRKGSTASEDSGARPVGAAKRPR
jgi:5-formyltetrahydrofolate cyclo-ligase